MWRCDLYATNIDPNASPGFGSVLDAGVTQVRATCKCGSQGNLPERSLRVPLEPCHSRVRNGVGEFMRFETISEARGSERFSADNVHANCCRTCGHMMLHVRRTCLMPISANPQSCATIHPCISKHALNRQTGPRILFGRSPKCASYFNLRGSWPALAHGSVPAKTFWIFGISPCPRFFAPFGSGTYSGTTGSARLL